jgi:hypothetical protein
LKTNSNFIEDSSDLIANENRFAALPNRRLTYSNIDHDSFGEAKCSMDIDEPHNDTNNTQNSFALPAAYNFQSNENNVNDHLIPEIEQENVPTTETETNIEPQQQTIEELALDEIVVNAHEIRHRSSKPKKLIVDKHTEFDIFEHQDNFDAYEAKFTRDDTFKSFNLAQVQKRSLLNTLLRGASSRLNKSPLCALYLRNMTTLTDDRLKKRPRQFDDGVDENIEAQPSKRRKVQHRGSKNANVLAEIQNIQQEVLQFDEIEFQPKQIEPFFDANNLPAANPKCEKLSREEKG